MTANDTATRRVTTPRVELTRIVIEQAAADEPLKLAILTMSARARPMAG